MTKTLTLIMIVAILLVLNMGALAQGGATPFLNSTHTYSVTMEDGANNDAQWVIADDEGNALDPQPLFTTNVDGNTATMEITWAESWTSVDSDYKILFTESDGNSCASRRELDIDIISNTFYLTMNGDASDCHALSGEILGEDEIGNTNLLFTVNLNKEETWEIDNWIFDFSVTTTGSYTIQSVNLNGGADLGNSGTYTGQIVAGTQSTSQIQVTVNGPVESAADVTITISNGKAVDGTISTPDNGNGDKIQVLTVDPLPATSIISFD